MTLPGPEYRIRRTDHLGHGTAINALLQAWSVLAWDRASSSGLDWYYYGGLLGYGDTTVDVPADYVTLADDTFNYVEAADDGTVSTNTTGWTSDRLPIALVATSGGEVVACQDRRRWLSWGGGGGGGGDVVGPDGATDGAIPLYDGVTGKLIKDGPAVVTEIGDPGSDDAVPTEQAVREALDGAAGDMTKAVYDPDDDGRVAASDEATVAEGLDDGTYTASAEEVRDHLDATDNPHAVTAAQAGAIADPATPEQGDVLYYNGSAWVRLPHGTAAQVLKTGGHGANPSWGDESGGWDGDIADINLDGGIDIGAALTDADLILVDDGAGGTNRKCAMSRVSTYVKKAIEHPYVIRVYEPATALATGDGKQYITIPIQFNGMNLVRAHAAVYTVSSSGTPTIQIARIRGANTDDMLSTRITIDASELTSYTAATAPVISGTYDDVATGDRLRIDVDVTGTGTKGLDIHLGFQEP